MSIKIDDEFQSLIPPLTDDEFQRLEKSILSEGVREPIITWDGTIIDGHNRYRICQGHGVDFKTTEREFESRDDAKLFIISNQLSRRNLPVAAIGLLKLEEKEIVARQAKERMLAGKSDPRPNLAQGNDSGKTLEILAKDIPLGRESLRKLDVIKREAEQGNEAAIAEREALKSGEKKSIHGAYVRITGDKTPRNRKETTTADGRRICAMCGEPINEGEAHSCRPTVHKKCEQEYQRDWEKTKKQPTQPQQNKASRGLLENKPSFTLDLLISELTWNAEKFIESWTQSIEVYESTGVKLRAAEKRRLEKAAAKLLVEVNKIKERTNNA